ncbi:MAG: tetratricopeptide repeat protein [Sphaerochaetaceae bacterium]|jgi:tetratricopeptide (TPR) repeat protein
MTQEHQNARSADGNLKERTGKLEDIIYIALPETMRQEINGFTVDPTKRIPLQLQQGRTGIDSTDEIGIEMIMAGLLKVVAWEPEHEDFAYYRDFVLALQPDAPKELNLAAIAKAKTGDYDFAEELFLAVNHLSPEPATFINLAVIYGERAAALEADKRQEQADLYQEKMLGTLAEGLNMFPDDPDLLAEIGTFNLYQGNMDIARDYLERYLAVAPDGPRKKQIANMLGDVKEKLNDDKTIMQAYDEIQLGNEEQALELLESFLKNNPKVWNAWFLKGWAHRRIGEYGPGQEAFLKCLELGESSSDIYNELAICTLEAGDRELAKNYLDIALDLDGDNVKLLSNLAFLHLRDGEYDQARELLERARACDEHDPGVRQLMHDYERQTGEKLSQIIIEEMVDADQLAKHDHDNDHAHSHAHGDDCGCGADHGEHPEA